jgi:hypothetical protein
MHDTNHKCICIIYALYLYFTGAGIYSVYKKTEPFKFKLTITYCSNLTALIVLNKWLGRNTRSCTHGTKLKEIKIRKFKRNTVFL